MNENQNVEYKETWRDEYLKWICGFANAQGGKIYVGIDDKGNVVGLSEYKKFLEEIPNKIASHFYEKWDVVGMIIFLKDMYQKSLLIIIP
jgi:predicted HTH transcriptional regulator